MDLIRSIYDNSIKFLTKTVKAAFVLSHGGLHLVVLILLIIAVSLFFITTNKQETMDVQNVSIDFRDESQMIKLTSLYGNIYLCNENDADCFDIGSFFDIDSTNLEKYLNTFNGSDFVYNNEIHDFICSISSDTLSLKLVDDVNNFRSYATFWEYRFNGPLKEYITNYCFTNNILRRENAKDNKHVVIKYKNSSGLFSLFKELYFPIVFHAKRDSKSNSSTKAYYLGLKTNFSHDLTDDSYVNVYFNKPNFEGNKLNNAFEIKYAYPQPDIITPFRIAYTKKESLNLLLKNKGAYLIVDNVSSRNKSNRDSIRNTVLIGAVIAFILDIIVDLILKWRRLYVPRKRKSTIKKRKKRL